MPVRRRIVIREKQVRAELPSWASEGAVLQEQLVARGRWAEVSEFLHVYRHVGYAAIDVAGFFVHYFASGGQTSLKEFGVRASQAGSQLAALGQRREFPTPSSVSRMLGRAVEDEVRSIGARLLVETTDAAALLQHPAASVRDTFGEPWHVFDVDATTKAFRERALPRGTDLPEPRRRVSPELARRGYVGRKRGELRCSRAALQHAGTGLWVAIALSPERADGAASLSSLLDGLELACRVGGITRERAILRADGAAGNVPWLTVCQRRGVPYLTRWGHYALLGQTEVQQLIKRGPWYRVPSSGSGPQREAMELGVVELHASPHTRAADGASFEPVRSRMVISRFRTEATSSVGHLVDGCLYELFATSVPADAWPAPELVAQYFGRAAEENRFAQEDRELGLDRVFSYNLSGQELACLFGLMVWNLRLVRGFTQHTPPTELPPPIPRASVIVAIESTAATGEIDPAVLTDAAETNTPTAVIPPTVPSATIPAVSVTTGNRDAGTGLTGDQERALFDELAWDALLARLGPRWKRAASGDGLTCPEGNFLHASKVIPSRHSGGLPSLRLLASEPACRRCPQRSSCAQTDSRFFAKKVSMPLTVSQAGPLERLLSSRTHQRRGKPHADTPNLSSSTVTSPRHRSPMLVSHEGAQTPGPYAPSETRLLPAEFRHAFERACRDVQIEVHIVETPAARQQRPLGLAATSAERQRRRRPWQERIRDNELPAAAKISLRVAGPRPALIALGMAAHKPAKSRREPEKI